MLRDGRDRLDAVLYTHGHKDHIAGLDDIRAYNFAQNGPIDLYLDALTEEGIRKEFEYIFAPNPYPGIPQVTLHRIEADVTIDIHGVQVLPIEVMHYRLPVIGYRIGGLTYITDANYISDVTMAAIQGTEVLVLNALRREKHISHFTLSEALEVAALVGAPQTYFTHISHQLGRHTEVSQELPEGVELAYDGLSIELP